MYRLKSSVQEEGLNRTLYETRLRDQPRHGHLSMGVDNVHRVSCKSLFETTFNLKKKEKIYNG